MRLEPVRQRTRIQIVQTGAIALLPAFFLTGPAWQGAAHEFIEIAGICLVFFCIIGRMWSILYVGSKKNHELVTVGPYSITRNPLYFFSTIGAIGIGLMYGSLLVSLLLGLLTYAVLITTASKEAAYLATVFGAEHERYARQTPLFWPDISLYREGPETHFSPKALKRTLLDGMLFLAAFPIIETIEYIQAEGYLPILMRLI